MPEKKKSNANPRIAKLEIGIREIREVKIYPLSIHDEFEMISIVKDVFSKISDDKSPQVTDTSKTKKRKSSPTRKKEKSGFDFLEVLAGELRNNFTEVISLITDPEDKVTLKELDNDQFADLVRLIYTMNFKESSKKLKDLFKEVAPKMEEQGINGSGLKRSLQKFSETMEDTDTNTSSDSHTSKEESPEDS